MRTHIDRLARVWLPAVEAVAPAESLRRAQRVDRAVSSNGMIDPDAIGLMPSPVVVMTIDDTQRATTSTSAYTTQVTARVHLTAGTWTVQALGLLRANHSSGTQSNARLYVHTTAGTALTRYCDPDYTSPLYMVETVTGIAGDQEISVLLQFKSSDAGTTTVNDGVIIVIATRTA